MTDACKVRNKIIEWLLLNRISFLIEFCAVFGATYSFSLGAQELSSTSWEELSDLAMFSINLVEAVRLAAK